MTTNTITVKNATIALIKFRPKYLLINILGRGFFVLSRLFPALLVQQILDQLTNSAPATVSIGTLLVMMLMIELSRVLAYFWGGRASAQVRNSNQFLLRQNIMERVLNQPAALGIPMSPGEAINRMDDDVADFADFPTWLPELMGHFVFFVVALVIMARISWQITAVSLIPLLLVGFLNRYAWQKFLHYATISRDSSSAVTGFLGEILTAVQVVKVADARHGVMGYFNTLNETRRVANVRFQTFWAIFRTAANNAGDIAIAIMILLAGQAIQAGSFTIGDFALFTSYLFFAARFPAEIGSYVSEWAQQRVSIQRMLSIEPHAPAGSLVKHGRIYETGAIPKPAEPKATVAPLSQLELQNVSYQYATGNGEQAGIFEVSMTIPHQSFTVITGRIGSGKSTLLRVLLGLLPHDSGDILWNGERVADPATFFVPPRSAYTPQVPRLFSDSLKDNILMGLPEDGVDWMAAVETAVLTPDLATLEHGIDTIVGPRGVRLSGGQVQRSAAARMFVRQPQLMVFDDLSSALDVETERKLWEGLRSMKQATTFLVVSHRPAVLEQADQVVVLENGRVAAVGKYDEVRGIKEVNSE